MYSLAAFLNVPLSVINAMSVDEYIGWNIWIRAHGERHPHKNNVSR